MHNLFKLSWLWGTLIVLGMVVIGWKSIPVATGQNPNTEETQSANSAGAKQVQSLVEASNAQQAVVLDGWEQPIAFSHQLHVEVNQIECQYCHIYARRSSSAGVPPVAICIGCHQQVGTKLPEIKKLLGYWERQEPIPWVKIHDLPDFVRFPHDKHVNAKNESFPTGVACQTCHGPIEKMAVVKKHDPNFGLMGWCLECHLTVPGMIEIKQGVAEAIASHRTKNWKHPGSDRPRANLIDCLTCHY